VCNSIYVHSVVSSIWFNIANVANILSEMHQCNFNCRCQNAQKVSAGVLKIC